MTTKMSRHKALLTIQPRHNNRLCHIESNTACHSYRLYHVPIDGPYTLIPPRFCAYQFIVFCRPARLPSHAYKYLLFLFIFIFFASCTEPNLKTPARLKILTSLTRPINLRIVSQQAMPNLRGAPLWHLNRRPSHKIIKHILLSEEDDQTM